MPTIYKLITLPCSRGVPKCRKMLCTLEPKRELQPQVTVDESEFSLSQIGNLSLVSNAGYNVTDYSGHG